MKTMEPNYYAANCLKPPKAFFEWCYSSMRTYEWSNKEETIVASTRKHREVIKKRLTSTSRLTFYDQRRNFIIILCSSKRIEIQTYLITAEFENGKQKFRHDLLNLEVLSNDRHIKITMDYPNGYKFGTTAVTGMFSYYYPELYPNNWLERLKQVSELRYVELDGIIASQLPHMYKYRAIIEFAQKIGATRLAWEIADNSPKLDMRTITPKWLKKHKQFLSNSNRSFEHIEMKKLIEARGGHMVPGIENYISFVRDINEFPREIGIVKFQNYLIKQKLPLSFYQDYVSMMADIGKPLTKRNMLPKDLAEAHDRAVQTLNALKREVTRKEFEVRAKELSHYEMTIGDYSFLLPKGADELIHEGKALEHCVGGSNYINKHAEGETTIVFIRDTQDINKPLYTMEYGRGIVIQVRGYDNQKAPDDVRNAVDAWLVAVSNNDKHKMAS